MTQDELNAIKARVEAATRGEWYAYILDAKMCSNTVYVVGDEYMVAGRLSYHDAMMIAHAPTDMRALLAEVARLTTDLDTARRQRETMQTVITQQADRIHWLESITPRAMLGWVAQQQAESKPTEEGDR